ncbi:MAG TPA: HipA domain-containing protein [Thermoleophilaceae bacterium]|nr:HipA domain-containing protein [Thermoleophilaceae bacterium]
MTSNGVRDQPETAFVWIWLSHATEPVVAGRVDQVGESLVFHYGRRYLERKDRISIYEPELPLVAGEQVPRVGKIHGCIADAGPDSWGQRVVLFRRLGHGDHDTTDLRQLTYLMAAGSDRIGALDFQKSATEYVSRKADAVPLEELVNAAQHVEDGVPLPPALSEALLRGTSIGGARPKALLDDGDRRLIAKFSSTGDTYPMVQGEFVAMRLAQLAGIRVANVEMTEALGKKIMLVERFDRLPGGQRRVMVSALTVLGLGEAGGRYASYADLAHIVRTRFTDPDPTLRDLFARITFNILTSNTDDHARNQAAFWDGELLTLTPAYDICPYPRAGGEAEQVMAIGEDGWRYSQVAGCVDRAAIYHLTRADAQEIVDHQIDVIKTHWDDVCDEAGLTQVERDTFRDRQFLNPFSLLDSHS